MYQSNNMVYLTFFCNKKMDKRLEYTIAVVAVIGITMYLLSNRKEEVEE